MSRGMQMDPKKKDFLQEKAQAILLVLDEPLVDLWALRAHAISEGGLVNGTLFGQTPHSICRTFFILSLACLTDVLRRRAWPKLVGLHERIWSTTEAPPSSRNVPEALVVTPKRSNVGASMEEGSAPRRLFTGNDSPREDEENDLAQQKQTKKVQDIFRSEVQNPHYKSSSAAPHPTVKDDEDGASLSSTSSFSSSSASMQASQRRSRLRSRAATPDKILASSLDATQIELDVLRCTWHLLTATQKRSQQLAGPQMVEHKKRYRKIMKIIHRKQRRLSNLINLTLIQSYQRIQYHSENMSSETSKDLTLRYYQGYHDVACIILSTMGISTSLSRWVPPTPSSLSLTTTGPTGFEMATAVLLQLSQSHLRDCMRPNFAQLQIVLRLTLFPLLAYFDRTVHEYLIQCNMMEPYFALSWIITWFSHDVRDTELVKRLFDFFIVSHPLMPIYVAIAMICHPFNRQDVLQCECDFSIVHQTLSSLPRNSSMVGWKYRPMDGQYVSDDENDGDSEEDEDDDLLSIGAMGSQSSVDTEFLLHEAATSKHTNKGGDHVVADAEAVSVVSSSMSSLYTARVPFQELLDMALQYMERMPPRNLIRLATRYYGRDYMQTELSIQRSTSKMNPHASAPTCSNDITFLQPPPTWTRSFTAHSDQTLKYYRNRRRVSSTDDAASLSEPLPPNSDNHPLVPTLLLKDPSTRWAVIAAGYGPGDDADRRRRKQRKRFLLLAGTALAAVVVAVIWQRSKSNVASSTSSSSPTAPPNASCPNNDRWTPPPPKLMATSARVAGPSSPNPVVPTKTGRLPECKTQRNPFERQCPSAGLLLEERRIQSPSWMLQPDDRTAIVPKGAASDLKSAVVTENLKELSHVVLAIVQGFSNKAQLLRNQLQQIGGAIFLSTWKNYVVQSRLWIEMTRLTWTQKLQDLPKLGTALAAVRAKLGHLLWGMQQGLRNNVDELQQSFVTKTSQVMTDAKSALELAESLEYNHGGSTSVQSMVMKPPLVRALEKEFQPPSLQDVTESVQRLIQNLAHLPIFQLLLELKSFGEIQKEQLVHLMASITAYYTQLAKFAELSGSQLEKLATMCHAYHLQIVTALRQFHAEHTFQLPDMAASEMLETVRSRVVNAVHSPAVRNAIRGASIFDQYSSSRSQQVEDALNAIPDHSDEKEEPSTKRASLLEVLQEEQCIVVPSFSFDELTIFD
jgi:Rab-GTPase-TBC domain